MRSVGGGGAWVSPSLGAAVISRFSGGKRPRGAALSDREYQVLRLFGSGIPFKQIAADPGVSPQTVSTYRSRVIGKLKVERNAGILPYALERPLAGAGDPAP